MRTKKTFPIACIGASAGGLEALTTLTNALPKYMDMALVLVQHLEPHHKSILTDILSRNTSLTVKEASNNMKVKPGHVYVIPPNSFLSISRKTLKITPRKYLDGRYMPVDFFMNSLAVSHGKNAIGVVLSGTGTDGTAGIKAIKARGGITFAQDQKTAKYYDMPSSAIASGSIDSILSPAAIADKLIEIGARRYKAVLRKQTPILTKEKAFNEILILLSELAGVDFTHYKRTTIERRIIRRMGFHRIASYGSYYNYLKKVPQEKAFLFKDMLIPVTTFFRDPKIFAVVRKKVLTSFIKKHRSGDPIRVWVPACSTGEEVYSIAIIIYESLEENGVKPYFQIFGTDISPAYINIARAASYKEDISTHISAVRLRRFFTRTETGYKVAKHIRDMCIFAKQDITNEPPLSNMDIVSCRNLLIYFDAVLQKKVLSTLCYALKPGGCLILGTSETITSVKDMFTTIDKKYKVYLKKVIDRRQILSASMPVSNPKSIRMRAAKKAVMPYKADKKPSGMYAPRTIAVKGISPGLSKPGKKNEMSSDKDLAKLEKKLTQAERHLYAIIDDKDTLNEELKAANEEIQSSNEELQSTNEELETAKEELQSTNEELLTVNDEMQNKNVELTRINNDLVNVLGSINIPLIIVNRELRIMRFTPTARKVMNLIPADVGRPIGDIKLKINIPNMEIAILDVIENMIPSGLEVKDSEGKWYSMCITPYKTTDNKIDGAVISLSDIDGIKRRQVELKEALDYADSIIETMREPLLVLGGNLCVLSANRAFCAYFNVSECDIKGKPLHEIIDNQFNIPRFLELLKEVLPKKAHFDDFELEISSSSVGKKTFVMNACQIGLREIGKEMILLAMEDVTVRRHNEDALKDKIALSKRLSDIGTLAATVAHELRNPLAAMSAAAFNIKRKINEPYSVERHADVIEKKILESDRIINNLLFYAHIRPPQRESINITHILRECLEIIEKQCYDRKITVVFDGEMNLKDYTSIEADPVQLKEVFSNILNNACEALTTPGGKIEISSREKDVFIEIAIKDNGVGMSRAHLDKIYDPFFTTKAKGTGLGLTVCKHIIDMHGGIMRIESEQNKGTKVSVALPKKETR